MSVGKEENERAAEVAEVVSAAVNEEYGECTACSTKACYELQPGSGTLQAWNEKHIRVMEAMRNAHSWTHTRL